MIGFLVDGWLKITLRQQVRNEFDFMSICLCSTEMCNFGWAIPLRLLSRILQVQPTMGVWWPWKLHPIFQLLACQTSKICICATIHTKTPLSLKWYRALRFHFKTELTNLMDIRARHYHKSQPGSRFWNRLQDKRVSAFYAKTLFFITGVQSGSRQQREGL